MAARVAVLAAVAVALLGAAGCGEDEGVAAGATVTAYVAAPLCGEAKRALASEGGRVGDLRVRALCLAEAEKGNRLNLATIGANARRASEDSTAVAFIEAPGPGARFSRPILDSAGIATISSRSGASAVARLLRAIEAAGSGSLREAVRDALDEA